MIKIVLYNTQLDDRYAVDNQSDSFILVDTNYEHAVILIESLDENRSMLYMTASYRRYSESPATLHKVPI